ncbi:MAG: class I adenylate-forming enzyme family protein [Parasphingorhabdus sp.]|uniref:class I adenylate-forming enzyme family protein n=1 Tax=Parasphingorhabdus sp. TaxID=2709688 RepID=UPI0032658D8A
MNIHLILQMAAEAMGDREAISAGDQRLTYAQLDHAARRVASRLQPGQRLAYLAENSPVMPAAIFGAALAGTPFVPINYRLAAEQVDALMARVAPALLISETAKPYADIDRISLADVATGTAMEGEAPDEKGGIAIELFTSGTTGEPKSAILRHSNLMAYIFGSVEFMSAGEEEASLVTVPPYHIAGISAVLSSTYAGRRMVQLPNFSPQGWIDLAQKEAVTHAFVVPTMLQHIVEHVGTNGGTLDLPNLRALSYGGGKMPLPVIEKAIELLPHVNFTNAYGLTETSSTICLLGPDAHRDAMASSDAHIRRRLGSVGQALPAIELQIRSEDGPVCAADEVGLVYVRGEQVGGEYKGIGSQLDDEGWFPTKDVGFVDSEGYLFLDGRADDVIVRGGENISPGEVEDVLLGHDGVKEVAVVAVPDQEWGEAVGAAIVCAGIAPGVAELCDLVRDKLRSSRVPAKIIFMDELPYNETGKLLRRVVRDQLAGQ